MNFLVRSYLAKHRRQYVAAGLAILISALFMAVAACFGNALNYTLRYDNYILAEGSDLIVARKSFGANSQINKLQATNSEDVFNKNKKAILQALPEIEAIEPYYNQVYTTAKSGKYQLNLGYSILPEQKDLYRPTLLSGRYPEKDNEVLLTADCLQELKLQIGDTFQLIHSWENKKTFTCTVVGVVKQDFYHRVNSSLKLYAKKELVQDNNILHLTAYRIQLHDNKQAASVLPKLKKYIAENNLLDKGWYLYEKADFIKKSLNSGNDIKVGIHLVMAVFPVLTLLVCFTIVSSTFHVILARRRREIGLLRCIGASRSQLLRYSLLECLAIGLIFSIIGVLLAYIIAFVVSVNFGLLASYKQVWQIVGIAPALWTCMAVSCVTVLAGLRPALENSRISPVSALQQIAYDLGSQTKVRASLRIAFGLLCVLSATFCFVLAIYFHAQESKNSFEAAYAMPALILGATLYLVVIVTLGKFFLAKLAATCLLPFQKKSIVVLMSRNNLLRNKERNGATMATLVLGIVMIVTTLIGAASLEATVYKGVKSALPVDLAVMMRKFEKSIKEDFIANLANVPGVEKLITSQAWPLPQRITIKGETKNLLEKEDSQNAYLLARPANLNEIGMDFLFAMQADEILVTPYSVIDAKDIDGKTISLQYGDTEINLKVKSVKEIERGLSSPGNLLGVIHPETAKKLAKLNLQPKIGLVLGELTANKVILQQKMVDEIRKLTRQDDFNLDGNVFFLALFNNVLQAIKLILICLITVVALVSLIGVANTLNLSVLERRHETALLRAIGFTKQQVKNILLTEGISLGLVSLLFGFIIGFAFAIFGLHVLPLGLLVTSANYCIAIPWLECIALSAFVLVLVYIATLLPSKQASQASVIADLASSQE